ncbi:MarR family transcriptional regulator [Pseudooceanicola sp. CBS1P-1]|uniref:MarR family transcriptional regulator n=1 Tax=Pseudooceanicola albus TaxID=2692189 RepID=A0A6L7G9N8_9RHOB|nr:MULTISPECIES: MarR family transcriptional regulator [Pseudooceanicola]MBT9386150.1 MarR family transcriptional regulator [Pseudooceanicola endophyticus]MXN19433.1 MarR family transcriptional regulator [Pseudooceanicola albus]
MPDQEDFALAERIRAATGAFVRQVRQGAGTPSDARLVTLAHLENQPASAAELARLRGVTHQTMRVLLAQLTQEALAESRPDPADARATLFSLTARGRDTLARSRAARAGWIAERWISGLSAQEKTALQVTLAALERLCGPPEAPPR